MKRLLAAGLAVLGTACSGGNSPVDGGAGADAGGGGGKPGITFAQFCDGLAAAECAYYDHCRADFRPYANTDACKTALHKLICDDAGTLAQAVSSSPPRLTFVPAAGQACIDSIQKWSCQGDGRVQAAACDLARVFLPNVQPANTCYHSAECLQGHCDIAAGSCDGHCSSYFLSGVDCSKDHAGCEPSSLYCDTVTNKCAARKADGSVCASDRECLPSHVCSTLGQCAPYAQRSQTCGAPRDCAPGLGCISGQCVGSVADGQPCSVGAAEPCRPGSACFGPPGQQPVCRPIAGEGGACFNVWDCASGLVCKQADVTYVNPGVCSKPKNANDVCLAPPPNGFGGECALTTGPDGMWCFGGKCTAYPAEGSPCEAAKDHCLGDDVFCGPQGKCLKASAGNQPCGVVDGGLQPCQTGFYCPSGTGVTCQTLKPNGQVCGGGGECQSGNCQGGLCVAACP